jgi:hypothetical protein
LSVAAVGVDLFLGGHAWVITRGRRRLTREIGCN